jgi:hypothetical protein
VGAGTGDFWENSVYEFGEYGAEGESEKLREEVRAGKMKSMLVASVSNVLDLNAHP